MDKKGLKIFFASTFGALIGSIIALSLGRYYWWIGMLAGGFVGYVSYEFSKIIQVSREVDRIITKWLSNRNEFKKRSMFHFWGILFSSNILFSGLVLWIIRVLIYEDSLKIMLIPLSLFYLAIAIINVLIIPLSIKFNSMSEKKEICSLVEYRFFKKYNFISVYFYYLPIWITKLIMAIPKLIIHRVINIVRFIKTMFILIHSREGLAVLFDAVMGVMVGYFTGYLIIGTTIGGLLGILSFEIFSKKILRLNSIN